MTLFNNPQFQPTDFFVLESEDHLMTDPFGAETFNQPVWSTIDPSLEVLRHHYAEYGLSYEGQYQPQTRLQQTAYDPVAHGFGYGIHPPMKKETYSMALSTDWYSLDSSRSARYVSPTASAMSTTSTSGDVFSPISGDGHSSQNNYETQQYPSPPASDSQEVKLSYMSSPPDQPYPPSGTILPDQPAFNMRDFEFSVNSDDEDAEGEDDETIAPVVEEDAISEEDNTNITTETQRQARTQVNDSDEEEEDATTRAASPVLDESDTDYKPAAQALRTPRRSTTKRISPLKDPDKSRVNKSSRKSKSKPRRSKTASSSPNKTDKLFPCPFAPFGCTAVFPNKNEWKRHTTTQHLCLGYYRCDLGTCHETHPSGVTRKRGFNDFNRKDLFVQHVRRMHWWEVCVEAGIDVGVDETTTTHQKISSGKKGGGGGGNKKTATGGGGGGYEALNKSAKTEFDDAMEEMRQRCWVVRREAPMDIRCAVVGCREKNKVMAWEERMEHVASCHWEKGEEVGDEGVDAGLLKWLVDEEMVVEVGEEGRYVLSELMGGTELQQGRMASDVTGGEEGEGRRRSRRAGLRNATTAPRKVDDERVQGEEEEAGAIEKWSLVGTGVHDTGIEIEEDNDDEEEDEDAAFEVE